MARFPKWRRARAARPADFDELNRGPRVRASRGIAQKNNAARRVRGWSSRARLPAFRASRPDLQSSRRERRVLEDFEPDAFGTLHHEAAEAVLRLERDRLLD